MEIILALVVTLAVIFFGALISAGNERQRRAIDSLREQVVLWALQDLTIKREHLVKTIQVPDPLGWLNKIASRVCGHDLQLHIVETSGTPQALVCTSGDGNRWVIFSPLAPADLRKIKKGRQNRLIQSAEQRSLLSLPKGAAVSELSVFNAGYLFDFELSLAWNALTGQNLEKVNRLWMYEFS
jgi:hypothetical protein